MNIVLKAAALAAFAVAPVAAFAAPVTGGNTVIRVTADLTPDTLPNLTIVPGVSGNATVLSASPLDVNVPITGGDLDPVTLAGTIEHSGSGITATAFGQTAGLDDFVIDTVAQAIFGDVTLNGAPVAEDLRLFNFDLSSVTTAQLIDLANPALELRFSAEFGAALVALAASLDQTIDDLSGTRIGFAATAPEIATVPAPAALALFGLGIVGMTALRRRAA